MLQSDDIFGFKSFQGIACIYYQFSMFHDGFVIEFGMGGDDNSAIYLTQIGGIQWCGMQEVMVRFL